LDEDGDKAVVRKVTFGPSKSALERMVGAVCGPKLDLILRSNRIEKASRPALIGIGKLTN
jgi:hypothetical protein